MVPTHFIHKSEFDQPYYDGDREWKANDNYNHNDLVTLETISCNGHYNWAFEN